jgi:hypothetical protein
MRMTARAMNDAARGSGFLRLNSSAERIHDFNSGFGHQSGRSVRVHIRRPRMTSIPGGVRSRLLRR